MNPTKPVLVIINNAAARARLSWPAIERTLVDRGVEFNVYETRFAGEATLRAREAIRDGCETIAVVGGDGTLSEAAAGFFDFNESGNSARLPLPINPNAALAILPTGTGDDFARSLANKSESLEHWIEALATHVHSDDEDRTRVIDVIYGRVNDGDRNFISINLASLGIGAEVAGRVGAQKGLMTRLPGEIRFVAGACGALINWRERRVLVTVDDSKPVECNSNLLAIANNRLAGGGMMFSPTASNDDGLLDVLIARDFSRLQIIRELGRIHRGGHIKNPKISIVKGTRVRIENVNPGEPLPIEADGNLRGETPVEFQIMHSAIRVVV